MDAFPIQPDLMPGEISMDLLMKCRAPLLFALWLAVPGLVPRGFVEARKNHAVPEQTQAAPQFIYPTIKDYGKVVRLAGAAQQPREGSKFCVDITRGGPPGELNPAIEKIARYVNIYGGAGKSPAKFQMAIVLHGDATLAALNTDAYVQIFHTRDNPHLDCLRKLREAGVEIYICGQSLIGKGAEPDQVAKLADVAVSALTTLVNLQADGFAYLPMLK